MEQDLMRNGCGRVIEALKHEHACAHAMPIQRRGSALRLACQPQHTSAYVGIRQHTSAYVSMRQRAAPRLPSTAYVSIRRHPSAPVSIRRHT
jgi:hypothetical protein